MLNIDRINELARKQREVGLTEEEKAEQAVLRRAYIDSVKQSFVSQMGTPEEWKAAKEEAKKDQK